MEMKELEQEFQAIITKAYNEVVDEYDHLLIKEGEESINFFKKVKKEVLDLIFSDKVRDMWNVKITTSRSYTYSKSEGFDDYDFIHDERKHTPLIKCGYSEEVRDRYVIAQGEETLTITIEEEPAINEDSSSGYSIFVYSDSDNLEFVLENDWSFDLRHYQE